MLTQEEKIKVELIKKTMTEKKTTFPSSGTKTVKTKNVNWKVKGIINNYPNQKYHWTKRSNL